MSDNTLHQDTRVPESHYGHDVGIVATPYRVEVGAGGEPRFVQCAEPMTNRWVEDSSELASAIAKGDVAVVDELAGVGDWLRSRRESFVMSEIVEVDPGRAWQAGGTEVVRVTSGWRGEVWAGVDWSTNTLTRWDSPSPETGVVVTDARWPSPEGQLATWRLEQPVAVGDPLRSRDDDAPPATVETAYAATPGRIPILVTPYGWLPDDEDLVEGDNWPSGLAAVDEDYDLLRGTRCERFAQLADPQVMQLSPTAQEVAALSGQRRCEISYRSDYLEDPRPSPASYVAPGEFGDASRLALNADVGLVRLSSELGECWLSWTGGTFHRDLHDLLLFDQSSATWGAPRMTDRVVNDPSWQTPEAVAAEMGLRIPFEEARKPRLEPLVVTPYVDEVYEATQEEQRLRYTARTQAPTVLMVATTPAMDSVLASGQVGKLLDVLASPGQHAAQAELADTPDSTSTVPSPHVAAASLERIVANATAAAARSAQEMPVAERPDQARFLLRFNGALSDGSPIDVWGELDGAGGVVALPYGWDCEEPPEVPHPGAVRVDWREVLAADNPSSSDIAGPVEAVMIGYRRNSNGELAAVSVPVRVQLSGEEAARVWSPARRLWPGDAVDSLHPGQLPEMSEELAGARKLIRTGQADLVRLVAATEEDVWLSKAPIGPSEWARTGEPFHPDGHYLYSRQGARRVASDRCIEPAEVLRQAGIQPGYIADTDTQPGRETVSGQPTHRGLPREPDHVQVAMVGYRYDRDRQMQMVPLDATAVLEVPLRDVRRAMRTEGGLKDEFPEARAMLQAGTADEVRLVAGNGEEVWVQVAGPFDGDDQFTFLHRRPDVVAMERMEPAGQVLARAGLTEPGVERVELPRGSEPPASLPELF